MMEPINTTISPWMPEQDRIRLAALGKLIEECNELSARAARCIIHGLNERDPDTDRINSEELRREAADVEACLAILGQVLDVRGDPDRTLSKTIGLYHWHDMIRANAQQPTPADAIAKARALLDAVTFDSDGIMVGMVRQGGNGGLLSNDTIRAADELRQALDALPHPQEHPYAGR